LPTPGLVLSPLHPFQIYFIIIHKLINFYILDCHGNPAAPVERHQGLVRRRCLGQYSDQLWQPTEEARSFGTRHRRENYFWESGRRWLMKFHSRFKRIKPLTGHLFPLDYGYESCPARFVTILIQLFIFSCADHALGWS
jgi:hypothetical protein